MDVGTVLRLGVRQLSTMLPEAAYLSTGFDVTRPTEIRASVTDRCNYKCLQCACWRFEDQDELSIDQWKAAFRSLKKFLGSYRVQFVGGEPFVKRGFLDLLEFCREESIDFGVITNGSAFASDRLVERFVKVGLLKVEISVDGPSPEIHDSLRGTPGSLAVISAGIRRLCDARQRLGIHFPIRIKATLNAVNFRSMPKLVEWAASHGATTIDIEPIREWTDESKTSLWPQVADLDDLHHVLTELIRLKTGGASLETSEHKIRGMLAHFRREKVEPEVSTCRVGLRTIGIDSKGIVRSCSHFAPLGDISRQSAREIWTGATARKLRREMVACRRGCVYGCQASKSLLERARRGLMVFGNSSP